MGKKAKKEAPEQEELNENVETAQSNPAITSTLSA